jgi:pre-mRNA-splicing factor ISY1
MARNVEKAALMLNRWTSMKDDMAKGERGGGGLGGRERRPYLASECRVLPEAERWRREVLRDISKKVAEIQNAGLGEARIRDLNDEINKLIREKGHWERQIKALGGPDYAASAPKITDADGRELPGGRGYKYFGAARDLPGVRELFVDPSAGAPRRTRGGVMKNITPDYYGFRDEDDGTLLAAEAERTAVLRAALHAGWLEEQQAAKRARLAGAGESAAAIAEVTEAAGGGGGGGAGAAGAGAGAGAAAFTSLTQAQAAVAARKRELLLAKYSSSELVAEQAASRAMLTGGKREGGGGSS